MSGFVQECVDRLNEVLGDVRARGMFGGHGLYFGGRMFALIAGDQLYFKADAVNKDIYLAGGSTPFLYESRDRTVEMSYYLVDLDSADIDDWARLAVEAAGRSASAKPRRKREA